MKKILATVLVFSFILSLLAMLPAFAISGSYGIITDKTTYNQGESIMVTVKGKNSDWIGIAKYNKSSQELLRIPVSYVGNGGGKFDLNYELETTIGTLDPGKYIIALIGEGADWVDIDGWRSSVTIEILPQPHLEVNKTTFESGESILVTARGDSTDWVGIAKYEKGSDKLIKIPVSSVGSGKQFDLQAKLKASSITLEPGKYIIALIVKGADWVDTDGWIASLTIEIKAQVTPVPATNTPTEKPTQVVTPAPTANPTAVPTEIPTAVPTEAPTAAPTDAPVDEPTAAPTDVPVNAPTDAPAAPTDAPKTEPSGNKSLSTGAVIGIVVCAAAVFAIALVVGILIGKKK